MYAYAEMSQTLHNAVLSKKRLPKSFRNYSKIITTIQQCKFYIFGQARLQRFADKLTQMQAEQKERYDSSDSDTPWICERQLTEDGININELLKEG